MVNLWSTALGHRVKSDPSDLSIEFLVNIAPFLLCIRRLSLTPVSVMQDLDTQSLRYDTILHRSLSTHHNHDNNIAATSRLRSSRWIMLRASELGIAHRSAAWCRFGLSVAIAGVAL
jgi:hypothetical protein